MSPKIISAASFFALLSCLGALPAMSQLAHLRFEPAEPSPFDRAANLFLHARVVAPRHWSDRVPEFATDGKRTNAGDHWAGEDIPVWHTVELAEAREINTIRMWTFWDDRRYYQYVIEGSLEGEQWTMLADNRANTTP